MKKINKKEKKCEHDWEKWKIYEDETGIFGGTLYQRRKCKKCNFTQLNQQVY